MNSLFYFILGFIFAFIVKKIFMKISEVLIYKYHYKLGDKGKEYFEEFKRLKEKRNGKM